MKLKEVGNQIFIFETIYLLIFFVTFSFIGQKPDGGAVLLMLVFYVILSILNTLLSTIFWYIIYNFEKDIFYKYFNFTSLVIFFTVNELTMYFFIEPFPIIGIFKFIADKIFLHKVIEDYVIVRIKGISTMYIAFFVSFFVWKFYKKRKEDIWNKILGNS